MLDDILFPLSAGPEPEPESPTDAIHCPGPAGIDMPCGAYLPRERLYAVQPPLGGAWGFVEWSWRCPRCARHSVKREALGTRKE